MGIVYTYTILEGSKKIIDLFELKHSKKYLTAHYTLQWEYF